MSKKIFKDKDTVGEKMIEDVLIARGGHFWNGKGKYQRPSNAKFVYLKQAPLYVHPDYPHRVDFTVVLSDVINKCEDIGEIEIEFDGEFHFRVLLNHNGLAQLLTQHSRDLEKNAFCEEMGFPLLRIRYNQVNQIEVLVDDILQNPHKYIKEHNPEWSTYYQETYDSIKNYTRRQ